MQNTLSMAICFATLLCTAQQSEAQASPDDIVAGRISQEPTKACIAEAMSRTEKLEKCAELSRQRTYTPPRSTYAMVNSYRSETLVWTELMNSAYSALTAFYTEQERQSASGEDLSDLLTKSQNAWIGWTISRCEYQYGRSGEGSMRMTNAAVCKHELTAARAIELEVIRHWEIERQ
ncbi:MAG: DUF1311 domain-containing protein [Henriciella sp.]|nr:DUF1311 domain-containing protein [Henriciella sp.]